MARIEWVIFDLGAVLIDWNPRYVYGRETEIPPKDQARPRPPAGGAYPIALAEKIDVFLRDVATGSWNAQMDAGILFQSAIDQRAVEFPLWRDWLQMWRDEWPTMMRAALPESVAVFRDVVARRRRGELRGVLALSNWEANTFKIARARFPFLEDFDARLISGEEKLIKPDPAFFRLLESRHGVVPENAIFVDDLPKNTEVARSLGYHVHLFENASKLRSDFTVRGILEKT